MRVVYDLVGNPLKVSSGLGGSKAYTLVRGSNNKILVEECLVAAVTTGIWANLKIVERQEQA